MVGAGGAACAAPEPVVQHQTQDIYNNTNTDSTAYIHSEFYAGSVLVNAARWYSQGLNLEM